MDRRAAILDAAFKVFLNYGFKRTTMADIADAAGISRPALYLEFKNKADIYRAGFLELIERTYRNVDSVLSGPGELVDRLIAAIREAIVVPMREIAQAPHGYELFEMKQELAVDLGQNWNRALQSSLERALAGAAQAREIDLERHGLAAADLARLIVLSAEGIKKSDCDWTSIEGDLSWIVELMVGPLVCHGGAQ